MKLESETPSPEHHTLLHLLEPDSYTAQKLQHATPEHLHYTTRRCFIGPIPEGWLKSHRRDWYKKHLHIQNYSSRAATFSADPKVGRHRRVTGLDGPSAAATFGRNFPQPDDLEETEQGGGLDNDGNRADAFSNDVEGSSADDLASRDLGKRKKGKQKKHATFEVDFEDDQTGPVAEPLDTTSKDLITSNYSAIEEANPDSSNEPNPTRGKTVKGSRRPSSMSFVTANETLSGVVPPNTFKSVPEVDSPAGTPGASSPPHDQALSERMSSTYDVGSSALAATSSSTASLLRQDRQEIAAIESTPSRLPNSDETAAGLHPNDSVLGTEETATAAKRERGLVKFDLDEDAREQHMRQRLVQLKHRGTIRRLRRTNAHDGEIIKMEKMLVRVEFTTNDLPEDYDENESLKIESRIWNKWKEFMVVCRESNHDDIEFVLKLYKTRVIKAIEHTHVKKHSTHEIPLDPKKVHVNLYSSLDKTMVISAPWKKGTIIYLVRPRSASNGMEWYTFLRSILGWARPNVLRVNVPDLNVSLRLHQPFKLLEGARDLAQAADGDDEAILRTMREEQAIAENIVHRCVGMLRQSPEWEPLVDAWTHNEKLGLAWKRFDRLEWVHGTNERKMYGTIAMDKSHELELRPKQHYPTTTAQKSGGELLEPPPVEGFLVRLTSQRGLDKRLGRLFFKRLYFSTHNNLFIFNRPAHAEPPTPPKLPTHNNADVPTAHEIAQSTPLIYSVTPFQVNERGLVDWLVDGPNGKKEEVRGKDTEAYYEFERKNNLMLQCDGVFDLCNIKEVRHVQRGASPVDDHIDEGSDVDFDQEVDDTRQDDGVVKDFDDERTFELLLHNNLVIRLQAFDTVTKKEWMKRLRALIDYWKLRTAGDVTLYKSVRAQNQAQLKINEATEARVGQFAHKWEVTNTFASPELYHVCGISCCRTIHLNGTLYRKTRVHAGFERCMVVLSNGHLIVFRDALRSSSGSVLPFIHHERLGSLDLRDCYVYSGLVTEGELGAVRSRFDGKAPGHSALPRMYLQDGWSSTDEDTMTTFVVWHGKQLSMFKRGDNQDATSGSGAGSKTAMFGRTSGGLVTGHGVKLVTRLGVTGRSIVFNTRSRAERDRWVMAISTEIERVAQGEDVRIVDRAET